MAESGVGTVAAGVAKAYADYVLIAGHSGGTGASPLSSIKHAGSPWELGLAEAKAMLVASGLRHRIEVRASGYATFGEDVDARFGETVRVNARLGATREENLAESPVLWTIIGVIVVGAAVGIPLGVWAGSPQVDAGNTGIVLMGIEVRH